jgi:uncharacterized protein (UPF0335 family)
MNDRPDLQAIRKWINSPHVRKGLFCYPDEGSIAEDALNALISEVERLGKENSSLRQDATYREIERDKAEKEVERLRAALNRIKEHRDTLEERRGGGEEMTTKMYCDWCGIEIAFRDVAEIGQLDDGELIQGTEEDVCGNCWSARKKEGEVKK